MKGNETPLTGHYNAIQSSGIAFSLIVFAVLLAIVFLGAWDALQQMLSQWGKEEYSYAYFVPPLVAFFIWQKKHALAQEPLTGSWGGMWLALFGLILMLFGELATLFTLVQYGFVITLHGIALVFLGWQGYRIVMVPLTMLLFVVPLPDFLYISLSAELQLISSQIGAWLIRLFEISVYLEGNVIHLAEMQLEVAEACSGLRYLFPLMAVGFMVAYIYDAPLWKKAVIFLSTIPITVMMNSFRIGLIGVTVEHWGPKAAEGLLHDFEGWVVFMGSLAVLLAAMWLLNQIGRRQRLSEAFFIDIPDPLPRGTRIDAPSLSMPIVLTLVLAVTGTALATMLPERQEIVPERLAFVGFPQQLGDWKGRGERLESIYVDALKLDDYLLADYVSRDGERVNLYAAYYGSQRKGASVHSPRTCLPGGGWRIAGLTQRTLISATVNGQPLSVNRAVIRLGEETQLVYYWFQQRGRVMTNEYLVKWFLFQDALLRRRTDGALVRLTTFVPPGGDLAAADARLTELARLTTAELEPYIPN